MEDFADFTGWVLESIVDKMVADGFTVHHTNEEREEYFNHVA